MRRPSRSGCGCITASTSLIDSDRLAEIEAGTAVIGGGDAGTLPVYLRVASIVSPLRLRALIWKA